MSDSESSYSSDSSDSSSDSSVSSDISDCEHIDFVGIYLLINLNPDPIYKDLTYIGKTFNLDIKEVLKEHNTGKTNVEANCDNGPWEMVLIVYGFPTKIEAKRFQSSWKEPAKAVELLQRFIHRGILTKESGETNFHFYKRVLREMLFTPPWQRLPLHVRWPIPEYSWQQDLSEEGPLDIPMHMLPSLEGPVITRFVKREDIINTKEEDHNGTVKVPDCNVCNLPVTSKDDEVNCVYKSCPMSAHIICLAKVFLKIQTSELIPTAGCCTLCKRVLRWGDIIRKMKGLSIFREYIDDKCQ